MKNEAHENVTDWMKGAWFQNFMEHSSLTKNKTPDQIKDLEQKIYANLLEFEHLQQKKEN